MSLVKTISFILLLSAVMLEGAPGRWDPQEGILTNARTDCKIEESPDQITHPFSLRIVYKNTQELYALLVHFRACRH